MQIKKLRFCIILILNTKTENSTSLAIKNSGFAHSEAVVFTLIQNKLINYSSLTEVPITFISLYSANSAAYHVFWKFCKTKITVFNGTFILLYEIRRLKLNSKRKGFSAFWYPVVGGEKRVSNALTYSFVSHINPGSITVICISLCCRIY